MPTPRPIWSADCRVSMPEPTGDERLVPMFGFAMGQYRLMHDITSVEYEDLRIIVGTPRDPTLPENPGDRNV